MIGKNYHPFLSRHMCQIHSQQPRTFAPESDEIVQMRARLNQTSQENRGQKKVFAQPTSPEVIAIVKRLMQQG